MLQEKTGQKVPQVTFRTRAGSPDLGWGFATVTVVSGNGIVTSASVIDSRTNDATTIAPKF